MSISVQGERCPQDHPCPAIRFCPVRAISQDGFQAPVVDQVLCINCGRCLQVCPHGVFIGDGQR